MQDADLNRLLNGLIEGTIRPEDFERLQLELRENRAARDAYYDLLGVDLLLAEQYEVPDYIAVHSQAMDNSWAVRRVRRRTVLWSALGAAAVLMLTLGTFFAIRSRVPEITFTASSDSHFTVNGNTGRSDRLGQDDTLELIHGVASLDLGPFVEACLEGPAKLRVIDPSGNVELSHGSAFFQIAPGGKGFEVHTPGGIIRDIGTKFGVRVHAGGRVETHVSSGAVEIDRGAGESPHRVDAGSAVTWSRSGSFRPQSLDSERFVQSLPWHSVVLREDFSDEDGTLLSGKQPDHGLPWMVLYEANPTRVKQGRLDTSYGPRTLSVGIRPDGGVGRRRVYVGTIATAKPENTSDKAGYFDAAESVTLWDRDGSPIFSLVARASRDHRWQMKEESHGSLSIGTRVSALEAHTLTFGYERDTGKVRLYEGPSTQGVFLDEIQAKAGANPGALSISNAEGGDLAIDSLEMRVVTYPQDAGSGD
jgi:hypothetical protein